MQSCRGNQIKSALIGLKIPILTLTKQCFDLQNLDQKSPGKQKIQQQPTLSELPSSFSRFEKQQIKYNKICETIQKQRKLSKITKKQKQCMEKICAVESINYINTMVLDHRGTDFGNKLKGNECQLQTFSDSPCSIHLGANKPENMNIKETRTNLEKIRKKPIIAALFQTQSIKISSFQHRQQQSNQNPQQYGTEKRLFSPKSNNYESSKKLFGSSNLPKRNDDQPQSASKILKNGKKLISSAEISKIHHHPLPHCHQSERRLKVLPSDGIQLNRQIFKKYQRQRLYEHQWKDMQDFKQTSDSLSSIKSIPKFLRCRKEPYSKEVTKGKNHYTINHILKIGQKLKLQVISHKSNTGTQNPSFHFQVLRLISDNYSTTVYLVRQLKTNFTFCLKKCLASVSASQFQFLVKQGKYGAMIDHPYLLKTYCTLYDKQNIYQLLQYMEGSTLFQKSHIDRLKISPKRSKKSPQLSSQLGFHKKLESVKLILSSLLEATVYLHHNGFIHRDIKPSNVFISHDFTIKLGDFGSCGRIGTREYVGTLDYVSPEVLLRQPYDEKIDTWAIGCLAYELWVGVPPFYHQLRSTTIVNIVQKDFDRQKLDHAQLLDLIQLLLEKDPKKRISAEEALEHPFLEQQSMSAPTSPMSPNMGSQLNYCRHYK